MTATASKRESGSFSREVGIGVLLSVLAAAATAAALMLFPAGTAVRGVIAAVALAYVCLSLCRTSEKTGRTVTLGVWLLVAACIWLSGVGIAGYVAAHLILLWSIRSLYFYSTLTEVALDLALALVSISFAAWAALRTDSMLLACWCFFLMQALHVFVPRLAARLTTPAAEPRRADDPNRRFAEASQAAAEALHRIASLD